MEKNAEIAVYQLDDGALQVRLDAKKDTVWLSLQQLAALFDRDKSVISRHLRNIFNDAELTRDSVVAISATTAADGKTYQVEYFNLEAIISVGYRVNSLSATRFRQWATQLIKPHLTQGYTLNRERLVANAQALEAALELVRKTAQSAELTGEIGRGLIDVVTRYTQTFLLLQQYDEGLLAYPEEQAGGILPTLVEARTALALLVAESKPEQKEVMIRLVMAMLGKESV
jgi:Virulence protein RhuM family